MEGEATADFSFRLFFAGTTRSGRSQSPATGIFPPPRSIASSSTYENQKVCDGGHLLIIMVDSICRLAAKREKTDGLKCLVWFLRNIIMHSGDTPLRAPVLLLTTPSTIHTLGHAHITHTPVDRRVCHCAAQLDWAADGECSSGLATEH